MGDNLCNSSSNFLLCYLNMFQTPTISYVQRRLGVGYNKAAGFIERMEQEGIVSAPDASGKRQVL